MAVVATIAATLSVTSGTAGATGAAASSYQPAVNAAVADLQSYWSKEFPQVYGGTYKRLAQVIAADPNTKIPDCQGRAISYAKDVKGNAFYCYQSNFIVYDNQVLFPRLAKNSGTFALALVLAHEWGHAIQDRAAIDPTPFQQSGQQILIELQADCFAGTWAKHIANGDSKTVKFTPGDLDTALSAYLNFSDPVGAAPDTPQSHGDAFDRVNAFQTGYDKGATACKTFLDSPPTITEQQFTNAQEAASGGNLPQQQVLPATMDLLHDFYSQVAPNVPPLALEQLKGYDGSGPSSQLPKCGGRTLSASQAKSRVFYCFSDNYIGYDRAILTSIYQTIGDFGEAVLIANAYATYVQFKQNFPGVKDNLTNAVFGADCYTGAWAGAVQAAGPPAGNGLPAPSLNTTLSLAAGDLDKVIQAFIKYDAARGVSTKTDFVFRRVEAFRQGFFNGSVSCTTTFGNSSTNTPSG